MVRSDTAHEMVYSDKAYEQSPLCRAKETNKDKDAGILGTEKQAQELHHMDAWSGVVVLNKMLFFFFARERGLTIQPRTHRVA